MIELPQDLNKFDDVMMREFFNSFDNVFTDCDGVLWCANNVIGNSNTLLNRLRELGKNVFFVTNNSSKSRNQALKKLLNLGFVAERDEIINPPYLVAEYLKRLNFRKKVYVIGYPSITEELDEFGIEHLEIGPDVLETDLLTYIKTGIALDPEVGAVIVGFDEHFSYPKMTKAINYLKNPDCIFLATEPDETFVIDGVIIPLGGCLAMSVEAATKRRALYVGKPSDFIVELVKEKYLVDPSRTLMIGDNCSTDIKFGKKCGFKTVLVLSGVTSLDEMIKFSESDNNRNLVPDFVIRQLGDLIPRSTIVDC